MVIYAVRDKDTGKLVSNLTNPRKKYWDRKQNALTAMSANNHINRVLKRNLELVTFELVEVSADIGSLTFFLSRLRSGHIHPRLLDTTALDLMVRARRIFRQTTLW